MKRNSVLKFIAVLVLASLAVPALAVDCWDNYGKCETGCNRVISSGPLYQACMDKCDATWEACVDNQQGGGGVGTDPSCPVYICPPYGFIVAPSPAKPHK